MEAAFAGTGVNLLLEVIPLSLGCTSGPIIEKKNVSDKFNSRL
jgi:hypothetical protein